MTTSKVVTLQNLEQYSEETKRYVREKADEAQYEAKKYLSNSYVPDINDKFHGKKDICLCFCLIRKFKYDNFAWNNTTLDEPNFIEYVKNNNIDLYP